jgi:hypothetical protein
MDRGSPTVVRRPLRLLRSTANAYLEATPVVTGMNPRKGTYMGIEDLANKAKDALGGEEAAGAKIDQAAEAIKGKVPEQATGAVDAAAGAAKKLVGGGEPAAAEGGEPA